MSVNKHKKTAIITGAAQGIGRALAFKCASLNMDLVLADVDGAALAATVQQIATDGLSVVAIITDVADQTSVTHLAQQSFAHFDHIDWVINNAGISGALGPVWELEPNEIRRVMDINLYGVLHGIRAFLPYLLKQARPSRIINMASMLGLCSCSKFAPYIISKHAVVALSEVLHHDLQQIAANIQVSVVCPGFVNTKLMGVSEANTLRSNITELIAQSSQPDKIAEMIIAGIEQQQFYILTHPEVKKYLQQRLDDINHGTAPSPNRVERLLTVLGG